MGWMTLPDGTVARTLSFEEWAKSQPTEAWREAREAWDDLVDNSGGLTAPGMNPVVDECRGCGRVGAGLWCYRCETRTW